MDKPYFYTWTKQKDASHFDLEAASDSFLHTSAKNKILDLTSISYQAGFGSSCTDITREIINQLDKLPMASPKADFDLKLEATDRLLSLIDLPGKIFYTVSGAEAIENALKMAREQRKAVTICARNISYHGATLGALSVTGDWRNKEHRTVDDWTLRIPEPTTDPQGLKTRKIIEDHGHERIAGIVLETITGGNGAYEAPESYWREIQKICKQYEIPLILDEVICGFFRTGKLFGFSHYDFLKPDFITFSKMMTGGYIPFGAVFVGSKFANYYDQRVLSCGLTNYAHPLGLAAFKGVLNHIEKEDFKKNLESNISLLSSFCKKYKKMRNVASVRQKGMLAAIDLNFQPEWKEGIKRGVYLIVTTKRIMLAPALNMNTKDLESGLNIISTYLAENP